MENKDLYNFDDFEKHMDSNWKEEFGKVELDEKCVENREKKYIIMKGVCPSYQKKNIDMICALNRHDGCHKKSCALFNGPLNARTADKG
jgi:hypothetical protein